MSSYSFTSWLGPAQYNAFYLSAEFQRDSFQKLTRESAEKANPEDSSKLRYKTNVVVRFVLENGWFIGYPSEQQSLELYLEEVPTFSHRVQLEDLPCVILNPSKDTRLSIHWSIDHLGEYCLAYTGTLIKEDTSSLGKRFSFEIKGSKENEIEVTKTQLEFNQHFQTRYRLPPNYPSWRNTISQTSRSFAPPITRAVGGVGEGLRAVGGALAILSEAVAIGLEPTGF